jgi:hypothetical protein
LVRKILVGAKIGNDICCGLVAAYDGFDVKDLTCGAVVAVVQIFDRAERAVGDIDRARVPGSSEQVRTLEGIRTPRSIQIFRTALPRSSNPR